MPSVLLYVPHYSLKHSVTREFIVNKFGDGYEQTITQESSNARADGTGGTNAHYGLNHFTIAYSKARLGSSLEAEGIWDFFRARLEANNEAFFFYNPSENLTIDPTGSDTIGRYLVRFADPNAALSREYFKYMLFSYAGINLIEARQIPS